MALGDGKGSYPHPRQARAVAGVALKPALASSPCIEDTSDDRLKQLRHRAWRLGGLAGSSLGFLPVSGPVGVGGGVLGAATARVIAGEQVGRTTKSVHVSCLLLAGRVRAHVVARLSTSATPYRLVPSPRFAHRASRARDCHVTQETNSRLRAR